MMHRSSERSQEAERDQSETLSNLVRSATSRSEADMLPMSSSEDDWERRLLEPCTASWLRLEVEPVSFPELPWRPGHITTASRDQQRAEE